MKKTIVMGLMSLAICLGICEMVQGGAVNCANNNVPYTLEIGGGAVWVTDGETPAAFTADIEPSGMSVTAPAWFLDPTGGGEGGLTTPVTTPSEDGMSATVQFFWHAVNPTQSLCFYTLECTTETDCVAEKVIILTLPEQPWGLTGRQVSAVLTGLPEGWMGRKRKITQLRISTIRDTSLDVNKFADTQSQFKTKVTDHEAEHATQFTGGSNSPAAVEARRRVEIYLADEGIVVGTSIVSISKYNELKDKVKEIVEEDVCGRDNSSWVEEEAFAVSNEIPPHYFEPEE